ncbi:SAM-dependent methyltransferase [Negadavirga shengliensis]|uniref:SAM-dependent methyltransferase n=1 Tax=Negadavirga shengliensis TaxID=1389218 RepID=A0ABV9T7F0_9BACT
MNNEKYTYLSLWIFLVFCTPLKAQEDRPSFVLDVPYVATPENIVDEMLDMAGVSAKDVLYDLGSGDGRIPIRAAITVGARGIGIDLNPERVREAIKNAKEAEVTDKVSFYEGDVFEVDFSEASVLTLYLFPEVNLKLRPRIQKMAPGTKIVSHNYDMGDWEPDLTKEIMGPDGRKHVLYLWKIPD